MEPMMSHASIQTIMALVSLGTDTNSAGYTGEFTTSVEDNYHSGFFSIALRISESSRVV
jgi:hypothetical protein